MPLILQDFRCKILRSTTKGESPIFYSLSKTKICEFEISIHVNKYVFRFQIAIDNTLTVKILEDEDDVRSIKTALNSTYEVLWGSKLPSSRRWENSSPPAMYSMKI
jgi:hypothetical protein